jgi:hypothetical protein
MTVTIPQLPVDELPNGLPMFNVFVHLPALGTRLQLFRLVRSYVVEQFTLHTLLVHPEEVDAVAELAGAVAFSQLHGEVWLFHVDGAMLALNRLGHPVSYRIRCDRSGLALLDGAGQLVAQETDPGDDAARVRLLRACFFLEYDDEALSVPLIRAYPGRTSLITQTRPFPRFFGTDPIGPSTSAVPVWPGDRGDG